jgi:hypothetical protein
MARTKTEETLEAREQEHADDPERAELIARARRFKTGWIELAESLVEARRSGVWQRWGHASFEAYTQRELSLRSETVDKLTGSYSFLQRRAPAVLERDGVRERIPSYQSVDFLRRAEESEVAPSEAKTALYERVIEEAKPVAAVNREFRDVVFPLAPEDRRAKDSAGVRNVAKRLRELLEETDVLPKGLSREAKDALDRVLQALAEDDTRAA